MTSFESGLGLDIVIWLQAHGSPLLDGLARMLNVLGGSLFVLVVGPLIYWSLDKRTGQHMVILLLLGGLVSTVVKLIVGTPRPFVAYPDQVARLVEAHGGGIPSGHVMNTVLFWFPLVLLYRGRLRWILYGGLVLLMVWSRMYVGAHYPQDVLAGLLLAVLILWLYYRLAFDPETIASPAWIVGLTLLSIAMIPLAWTYRDGLNGIGAFWGMLWGVWAERRYVQFTTRGDLIQRGLRYSAGLIILLAIFLSLRVLFSSLDPAAAFRVLRYGVVTLWAAAGWPWTWQRLGW